MGRHGKVFEVAVLEDFEVVGSQVGEGAPGRLFQAGSISKPVAALVALELAARGDLDLDADVNDRLTGWRLPGPRGVSLRRLLGHTSGLGVSFYPGYAQGADVPTLRQSLDGVPPATTKPVRADSGQVNPARGDPVRAGRGQTGRGQTGRGQTGRGQTGRGQTGRGQTVRFRYSGGGYTVVQQLISEVTGLPFAEAARTLVLEPAGMTSSTFCQPLPAGLRAAAARPDWRVYPEAAAAGLWTTPGDLARFAGAVAAAAAGRDSAVRPAAAAGLLSVCTRVPARGEWMMLPALGLRRPEACGLGLFGFGEDRFGHLGGAAGFFSILAGSWRDGRAAVIMTAANPSPFPFRLLRAISDEQGWTGFRSRGWPRSGRKTAAGTGV